VIISGKDVDWRNLRRFVAECKEQMKILRKNKKKFLKVKKDKNIFLDIN